MKNFPTHCIIVFAITTFYSCKKETAVTQNKSVEVSVVSEETIAGSRWQGAFISLNGLPASRSVSDKYFIANGYARIYDDSIRIQRKNYYSTQFRLVIPPSVKIKGDSVNFEIGVKNPSSSSFYIPYHGRDVGLYMKGETDSVFINNVVPDSIRPDAHEYAVMQIGGNRINNVTGLQYLFEDWGSFVLQTFNNGLVAYRNNEYIHGLPYNGQPLVGRLREIGILFKGSGYIDWVKLYNSVNGKLIMSEDFNTDGQSTVIWY